MPALLQVNMHEGRREERAKWSSNCLLAICGACPSPSSDNTWSHLEAPFHLFPQVIRLWVTSIDSSVSGGLVPPTWIFLASGSERDPL